MKESIIFTNTHYLGNIGDYWSSPLHYYSFPFKIEHIHYIDIVKDLNNGRIDKYKNRKIIIGGGGMIDGDILSNTLKYLIENNKVILWGIGTNAINEYSLDMLNHPNVILKGIRDYIKEIDVEIYLPCVSCKNHLFNKLIDKKPKKKFGILEHKHHRIYLEQISSIVHDQPIGNFIHYIGDHNKLISSTYHGIYWAQLLKKEVAFYNDSIYVNSKFKNLKFPIPIVTNKNIRNWNIDTSIYNGYLEESVLLNDQFYNKVLMYLSNNDKT